MTELKPTLDWIDTLAERRGLDDETKEIASVVARRHINTCPENHLPKTVARNAVEMAQDPDGVTDVSFDT